MSDDVTNLAEVLRSAAYMAMRRGVRQLPEDMASAVIHSQWLAERDQANRLIGAAMAHTDAIAAYAELVERVEALAGEWSSLAGLLRRNQSMQSDIESVALSQRATELRALIDPEATP